MDAQHAHAAALTETEFATSFWTQLFVLSRRMFVQSWRNKIGLAIQMLHAIVSATFLGGIFINVGDNVTRPFENFKFCIGVLVYFMFTQFMVPILLCECLAGSLNLSEIYFSRLQWFARLAFTIGRLRVHANALL